MRQMTLVGFLQAQNCTNFVGSWRHPLARQDFTSAEYYRRIGRGPRSREVPPRLLRRPPRHARPVRRRPRPHRRQRHPLRQARPDHHPHRHGHGDRTPRSRRHLLDHLFRAVPRRPRVRHARPGDRRPSRLEHRHLDERRRGPEHGPRLPRRPRPPLRPCRRVPRSRHGPLGRVGGRRHRRRPRAPACSPTRKKSTAWTTTASSSAPAARSPCPAPPRATRSSIQAGQSGRGQEIRRPLGRMRLRQLPQPAPGPAGLRRLQDPGRSRQAATRPKGLRLRRRLSGRRRNPKPRRRTTPP